MGDIMYPIGTPGKPWGETEKAQWLAMQTKKRSYEQEVLNQLDSVSQKLVKEQYGELPYDTHAYPLFALCSSQWQNDKPAILVTGGVHGYETSGVQGALLFASTAIESYISDFNFIVVPCVSPWGYETINRWNPYAVDPNRSFHADSGSPEAMLLMDYIEKKGCQILAHIDLHETTDTDNTEFRPALSARDAIEQKSWSIPDGFYLVADEQKPCIDFQQALINQVAKVTHIAPADEDGKIIGANVLSEGVICYDKKALFLCGGFTSAPYCSTTEVYPDSPTATEEQCNLAQVAAIEGALQYLIKADKAA